MADFDTTEGPDDLDPDDLDPDDLDIVLDGDLADDVEGDLEDDFDFADAIEGDLEDDGDLDDELAGLGLEELEEDDADESLEELEEEPDEPDDEADVEPGVAGDDGESTALVEDADDLLDELGTEAVPGARDLDVDDEVREGEFVCRSCFMAKRESALADEENLLCRDCV